MYSIPPFAFLVSHAAIVSQPVTRLPSPGRPGGSGPIPSGPPIYNRPEHNIFLKMQMADPLARVQRLRSAPPERVSEKETGKGREMGTGAGKTEGTGLEQKAGAEEGATIRAPSEEKERKDTREKA